MNQLQPGINPFMLMTDPQAVLSALASHDRLSRLSSRLCRPLDNPSIGGGTDEEWDATDDSEFELSELPALGDHAQ